MAGVSKHLDREHPIATSRERSFFNREDISLQKYHSYLHDEYQESTPHHHDEHGRILFHDRREEK